MAPCKRIGIFYKIKRKIKKLATKMRFVQFNK